MLEEAGDRGGGGGVGNKGNTTGRRSRDVLALGKVRAEETRIAL